MKRVAYVSQAARKLEPQELDEIAEASVHNNSLVGLTGVLFWFNDVFYQVIEGDDIAVDETYRRISSDPRHNNIFRLSAEQDITERLYGGWDMKLVRLETEQEPLFASMRAMLDSLARTHRDLRLYTPREILNSIQDAESPTDIEAVNERKVVLFSDIVNSSMLHETLPPDTMTQALSHFYEVAIGVVEGMGGVVSKLAGDGIMAYFPDGKDAAAIAAGIRIQELLADKRSAYPDGPAALIHAGIGISAGVVRLGNIGSRHRKDFTLLGSPVNTAARLESATRRVGANLVFDESVDPTELQLPVRRLGTVRLRGKNEPATLFTVDKPATTWERPGDAVRDGLLSRKSA